MEARLKELQQEALEKIEAASELKELNDVRVAYLGKKGPITEVFARYGQIVRRGASSYGSTCE
ncbi:hypothetical protein GCM10020331_033130 [Ectobacillus funiculus]